MNYVIFDMEWNQPYANDISFLKRTKVPIAGEIIQIGAVKLNEKLELLDTFKVLVNPRYLKHMNRHVQSLTGITSAELRGGIPFRSAYRLFDQWLGGETTLLSWGSDDIYMLRDNLRLHGLSGTISYPWYDAQRIYAFEVHGDGRQCSLQKAMEEKAIPQDDLEAHDALHDAIFTARICRAMDLKKGIAEYHSMDAVSPAPVFFPDELAFFMYESFQDKKRVMKDNRVRQAFCPTCQKRLKLGKPERTGGDKYVSTGTCEHHGRFAVQWKVGRYQEKKRLVRFYVTKTITQSTPEIEQLYIHKAEINRIKEERFLARLQAREEAEAEEQRTTNE